MNATATDCNEAYACADLSATLSRLVRAAMTVACLQRNLLVPIADMHSNALDVWECK